MPTPDEILDAEDARLREDRDAYRVQWNGAMWALERAWALWCRANRKPHHARLAEQLAAEAKRQRELADRAWDGAVACDHRLAEIGAERRKE